MTCRGLFIISVAILCASIPLGGCAIPIVVSVASYSFDAFSYGVEGKSMSDMALSNVMGEDCSMFRVIGGDAICHDYSPQQKQAQDRFLAEAGTSNRHTDRVDMPADFYGSADKAEQANTVLLAATSNDANRVSIAPPLASFSSSTAASAKIPADRTTKSSIAVAILTLDEPQRSAALPRSAQTLPAVAALPTPGANTIPTQLASAIGFLEPPRTNRPEQPMIAPRLGLDLDTMLLTE